MSIPPVILARLSPAGMSKALHPERKIARHVIHISDRLGEAIQRGRGRIIVTAPPGHAKSDTVSVHLPLWYLETWPDRNVVIASNTSRLANKWGRIVRNEAESRPDIFLMRIAKDSAAVDLWHTTDGGMMRTVGVGGLLSGFRANLLIVDDPIADSKEARSKTQRDALWDWFQEVALTRLRPNGTVVVMHTRWNEDDLVGRIQAQQKELAEQDLPHDQWETINLPALAEEGDQLGREPGEALWPEQFNREVLEIEKSRGSRRWASLYQQRPSPEAGSYFRRKDFRYFSHGESWYELPQPDETTKRVPFDQCEVYQVCDTAIEAKSSSDFTVVLTFAVTPDHELLILEVVRERLEVPDQLGFLYAQRARYPRLSWQGVEKRASGAGLIQAAKRRGLPFKALEADAAKEVRASPASVLYENGCVYHRAGAPWLDAFEDELLSFPHGKHDDQVDCLAYAGREVESDPLQVFF